MLKGGIAGDVDDVLGIIFKEQDESNHRTTIASLGPMACGSGNDAEHALVWGR